MWGNLRQLKRGKTDLSWYWEQGELEQEIINLRLALVGKGSNKTDVFRKCQILTNLGNHFSHVGRFVEAIDYWNKALALYPKFSMALANKGQGFVSYSYFVRDQTYVVLFLKYAHNFISNALSMRDPNFYKEARKGFKDIRKSIETRLSKEYIQRKIDLDDYSIGKTKQEIKYRKWCLSNQLFLTPLNDLCTQAVAAVDGLVLPSVIVKIGEGPYYHGLFNQIKQEFISARYLFYDGVTSNKVHYSDREVTLSNTLDYPAYSLAVEKVKATFRMTYSIFDKIAFFLNKYLNLSVNDHRISFRTIWYASQKRQKGLASIFIKNENLPLRGLFWLSKDLHESKKDFQESIEPEAKELAKIRNHLEHKYLKVHDYLVLRPGGLSDTLAYSIERGDFESKTLKLLKMTRAAIIYLALSIFDEEERSGKRNSVNVTPSIPLGNIDDEWKR